MSRLIFLRWLVGVIGSWPLRPAIGPADTMILEVPKGWEIEYRDRSLLAERADGGARFSLTLTPKLEAPPTDGGLLVLGGVKGEEVQNPVVCRELDGTYTRTVEYRRGNRYGLLAGIYAARRLWLWKLEGPWREREYLGYLGKVALRGIDCRLPLVVAQQRHDLGGELTIRIGPGFRLALPRQWRIIPAGAYDFLAEYGVEGAPVAEIGVITSGPATDNENRALFLESMLLDVESHRPGFRLLESVPTETAGLLAQRLNGIYSVDGVPFRWMAVVIYGGRGTYAIHGETTEANHGRFEVLFNRVAESLREGSVGTWYEALWEYLSSHVLTVFVPLLIAVAAGLFFSLRWFWRFLLRYTR
ncbi:hypothetical protein KAU45_00985 [bacterium]|nr:hypothetical protein [bacterium]